jgi:hypothetical protein
MKKVSIQFLVIAVLVLPLTVLSQTKKADKRSRRMIRKVKKAESSDLDNWPAGASPKEIGDRVAARFIATPHPNFGRPTPPKRITYPEVCTWFGALTFAKESQQQNTS